MDHDHRTAPRSRSATVVAVLLALLFGHFGGTAAAQDAENGHLTGTEQAAEDGGDTGPGQVTWGISPAAADGRDTRSTIEHVVEPDSTFVDHVVVDNFGESPVAVDLYASDARPAGGAFDVMAADEPSEAIGTWIELAETSLEVPARDQVIVPFEVRVPENAEPGDHAGGILASRRAAGTGDDVGLETERRVGARVYLRVAGPVRPSLEVTELRAGYDHRVDPVGRGEVEVTYRVENTGNIRLGGSTELVVQGPFGLARRTATGEAIDDLLPGHWVEQRLTLDALPLGPLDVDVRVTPTVSIDQPLDGAVTVHQASTRLWAVPFAALAVLTVVVLAVAAWRWRRRRRYRSAREADAPADEPAEQPEERVAEPAPG